MEEVEFSEQQIFDPRPTECFTSLCVNPPKDALTSVVRYIFLN